MLKKITLEPYAPVYIIVNMLQDAQKLEFSAADYPPPKKKKQENNKKKNMSL